MIVLSVHIGSRSFQIKTTLCGWYSYKSKILSKPVTNGNGYINYCICIKFESSSVKNGLRNAKKVQITNKVIMHIFNEVE